MNAAPYYLRLEEWGPVAEMLEEVRYRDESTETMAATVPFLRAVVVATSGDSKHARYSRILASALSDAGNLDVAEGILRRVAVDSESLLDFKEASVALDELIDILRRTGRAGEAYDLVPQMADYTVRSGLGPWSQLADQSWRVRLLNDLGRFEEAFAEAETLIARMIQLSTRSDLREATYPWAVRELLYDAARTAALNLSQWQKALDWNARSINSQIDRKAPELEVARLRINVCVPLIALQKAQEAEAIALSCKDLFERETAADDLASTFSVLARVQNVFGHRKQSVLHQRTALRFSYVNRDPETCAECHFQLGSYLASGTGESR